MATEVITALLAMTGTLVGSLAGIMTANKLAIYRIEQLEKKVEKHNTVVERMTTLEITVNNLLEYEKEHERREGYVGDNAAIRFGRC